MNDLCQTALQSYLETVGAAFEMSPTRGGCVLVTPYMRSDNECIEVELVPRHEGKVMLTDNAETIGYLFVNGLNVHRSRELSRRVTQTIKRFAVQFEADEIFAICDTAAMGDGLHRVVSAVQDISYLIYRKVRRAPVAFDEEVERLLIANRITYDADFELQGRVERHRFRFHVDQQRRALIEPLTATSTHAALVKAERLAFRWTDIGHIQPQYFKIAVVDDVAAKAELWVGRPLDVLHGYSDKMILWADKEELVRTISQRA